MCRCTGCCGRPGRHHGRRQQLPVGGVAAACGRSGTLWRTARHQAVTRAARARRRTFSRPQRRSRKPSGPRPRRRRRQRRRPRLPPAGPRPQDAGLAEAAPGAKRQKTGGWAQDEEVRVISSSRAPNVTRAALGLEEWELYVSPHRCHQSAHGLHRCQPWHVNRGMQCDDAVQGNDVAPAYRTPANVTPSSGALPVVLQVTD